MHMTLTLDPSDATDLDAVRSLLDRLTTHSPPPHASPAGTALPDLREIAHSVVGAPGTYGDNRLGYLRRVAEAGDEGVDVAELLAEHFNGSHQSFGGTHASIERNWRAAGGSQHADQIIDDVRREGATRHVMHGPARELVLELIK
jgi:hypothetical protein